MPLVIVESPNKIPSIKKCLDKSFQVEASMGHIMDLRKKNMGIELPEFEPVYEVYPEKKDIVKRIKEAAKNHDEIYIATDADREGEAIAYNIQSILPKRGKKIYRVLFKEINKREILKGLKNPCGFREPVYNAQQARRITDRLVGFKVSPLMWTKGLKNTSAGRVQSAALKIIVDREKEILAFVKDEFWSIKAETDSNFIAEFYAIDGKKVTPKTKKETEAIVKDLGKKLLVTKFTKKTRSRAPSAPFETATLQQDAGSRWSWTGKRTMEVAQSLFSQGLITYHRTDSTRCDPDKIKYIRDMIEEKHGKGYLSAKPIEYGPKEEAQDAHECIRPTFYSAPAGLSGDERKLYNIIGARFMASQMAEAKFDQASMELEAKGKKVYNFKASGSVQQFDGFLKVYGSAQNDVSIPAIEEGEDVSVKKVHPKQHFTQPPKRYTGPSLTKKVKKEGIGRPSTYAVIDDTLIRKGYVERKKGSLHATDIGIMVCDYLDHFFANLTDAKFTANMEKELDLIEKGKAKIKKTLENFLVILDKDIDLAKRGSQLDVFRTDIDCKSCNDGSKMAKKIGKHGIFLGCENYPKCGHVINFDEDGNMKDDEVETGLACPVCHNKVRLIKGKWGEFYGCTAYPVCSWTGHMNDEGDLVTKEKKKVETSEHDCPSCGEGKLVKRGGKNGDFYGCSRYPKCKHTANIGEDGVPLEKKGRAKKAAPKGTGKTCPKCNKNELVERDGRYGKFVACSGYPKCKHIEK